MLTWREVWDWTLDITKSTWRYTMPWISHEFLYTLLWFKFSYKFSSDFRIHFEFVGRIWGFKVDPEFLDTTSFEYNYNFQLFLWSSGALRILGYRLNFSILWIFGSTVNFRIHFTQRVSLVTRQASSPKRGNLFTANITQDGGCRGTAVSYECTRDFAL